MTMVGCTALLAIFLSLSTCLYVSEAQLLEPIITFKRLSLASQLSGGNPRYVAATEDELAAIWRKAVQGARIKDSVIESNLIRNCKLLPMSCRFGEKSLLWGNSKRRLLKWNSLI